MLSFKIHERYIFPALLFLLMTYVYEQKKKLLFLYGGFSVVFFINCVNIYQKWVPGKTPIVDPLLGKLFSLANIILTIILIIFSMNNYVFANTNDKKQKNKINIFEIKSRNIKKLAGITKKDYIIMFIISFIYAIVAFSNLGDHKFPKTFLKTKKESNAIIDFNSQQYLKRIQVLNGVRPDKKISLYFSDDCINWRDNTDFEFKGVTHVFKWEEKKLGVQARYVNIVFKDDDMYVYEIAFRDNENKILPIKIIFNDDAKNIFDEQNLVPESSDYKNSTYFDEVYHARTGFEFLNRLKAYETTHPPLGKDIIALGIKIFGMNPFGWRFFGTLFGVLMLPAFYYLAKKIFSRTLWATFATVLFASDFMHFVQTRIATVDSYTLFFIILMFTSMFIYCHLDFFDDKQKINNISTLIFCAIFTGLACATKWQGFYALAGLIIIFIMNLNLNYRKALKDINLKNKFKNRAILQINLCMFLFVFISLTIYFASYFLYIKTDGVNNNFSSIIKNQLDMFSYHAFLKSSHPFGSKWWQWVLNLRPILFYNHTFSTNVHTGISSFLNPVVCYGGLIGIFYCIAYLTYIFDANIAFVLIAYLSGLVPWMLIKRVTFEYHYFPCSPFLILLFTFFVRDIIYPKFGKRSVIFLSSVSIILFAMFYPVLVGLPVSDKYVNMILKWFPSWNLI
jgi:predicted membrane-bound dolichyl-phosphate-mannose-protein mannosyltransferase